MYAFGVTTSLFVADFLRRWIAAKLSQPFTLAFSNTPGVLKPLNFGHSEVWGMAGTVIPSGKMGICISVLSYTEAIRISALVDERVLSH